ncbi:MAG: Mur ligase domain-containing protein, partial [Candidatus Dormibacteria bacterium]
MAPGGWPDPPAHLHLLGVCGYAVSGLALAVAELGYRVTGSDEDAYPPTTDILDSAGVAFADQHDPLNLDRWGVPDLVVLGNQVQAGNLELAAALARGLPVVSEAEAQGLLAANRRRAVICGTHGKTTTASLCAWMLEGAGLNPGFRLGSTSRDFGATVRLGDLRSPFVFEGDEYTTSALDRRAKFLHWRPEVVALLNLELDHPDIYPDLEAYTAPYRTLLDGLPEGGVLLVNGEDPGAERLARGFRGRLQRWGLDSGDWRLARPARLEGRSQLLEVVGPERVRVAM